MRLHMKTIRQALVAAVGLVGLAFAVPAQAGTIILEGSDAIGFHCAGGSVGACTYRDQAFSAIGGSDPRPIAVFGNTVNGSAVTSGTHAVSDFASVAAAGSLNNYVALYFLAASGCCTEDDSLITAAGASTAVASYLSAGGTVMIENYNGGSAWDFAVGAGGAGTAHVAGIGGGISSGLSCSDGETVTPTGTANGFTQPPVMGCWTHQAYDQSFFGPLGFTLSFFNSPTGIGVDGFSSLLSSGRTVVGAPEPAALALLGVGLIGLGLVRRRRG